MSRHPGAGSRGGSSGYGLRSRRERVALTQGIVVRPSAELLVTAVPNLMDRTGVRSAGDCEFHLDFHWGTARGSLVPGNQQTMIYICFSEFDPTFKTTSSQDSDTRGGIRHNDREFGPKMRRYNPFRVQRRPKARNVVDERISCGTHEGGTYRSGSALTFATCLLRWIS